MEKNIYKAIMKVKDSDVLKARRKLPGTRLRPRISNSPSLQGRSSQSKVHPAKRQNSMEAVGAKFIYEFRCQKNQLSWLEGKEMSMTGVWVHARRGPADPSSGSARQQQSNLQRQILLPWSAPWFHQGLVSWASGHGGGVFRSICLGHKF